VSIEALTQVEELKKLGKNEYYKCPFPHVHPRHKQGFFKDFDAHFRIFGDREDHFVVVQLHEELTWNMRHSASEKGALDEEDVRRISLAAWLEAIKQHTGKEIQVVSKK
jgi:hypothetical protein